MNRNSLLFICGAILIVIGAVLLYVRYHSTSNASVIKIGYVSPLTGDAATYGEPMKNAASLAVQEINDAGGVNGKKLEIMYEDSKCYGNDALSAVQKLVSIDGVKILDGLACAGDVLTIAPVVEQSKILTLAPGASGPEVSLAGDYIFQVDPSTTVALQLLSVLVHKNYKDMAMISEETSFATANKDYFTKIFQSLGGKIVSSETYSSNTKDFRGILAKIKAAKPSAIFVNPQTEITGGLIIKQARELGIMAQFFGLDILSGPTVRKISGSASEGLTLITVPDLDPHNKQAESFLAKYKTEFGEPPFALYLAAAYDSVNIIAQAIKKVGENPTKLKDYLYHMPDYHGAVGVYHFDRNGDIVGINFIVKKVKSGNLLNATE